MIKDFLGKMPRWIPSVVVMLAILWLTLSPADDVPSVGLFPGADKLIHALMMGALAVALMWDLGRANLAVRWWGVALCVSTIGAGIEILQWAMGMGRSAEWADVAADAIGAFTFAYGYKMLFRPIVLCRVDDVSRISEKIERLYYDSFPEYERRPWPKQLEMIADDDIPMSLYVAVDADGREVGFMTLWRFDGFDYLEHFAVNPALRGRGYGRSCLKRLMDMIKPAGLVFEVEPPQVSEQARRRIAFYQRCGFELHGKYEYIQPPYTPNLQPVELRLMTGGVDNPDLDKITAVLHRQVYQKR